MVLRQPKIVAGGIKILHVDEDHSFSTLVRQFLTGRNEEFEICTETSAQEGLDRLDDERIECIVSDHELPEMDGLAFLEAVRDEGHEMPFILFTGDGSEDLASEAISAGVTDYIKQEDGTEQYTVLANRIEMAVDGYLSRRELERTRERFARFFEQSPLGVIEWTGDLKVARVNAKIEDLFGYDRSELVGQSWQVLVQDDRHDTVRTAIEELLADGGIHHDVVDMETKDGRTIVCEYYNHIVTDADGEIAAAFSQFQEVTDRIETRRRLETMIHNLPGIVYRHSEESEQPFELVRGSCEELTGYTAEEFSEDVDLPGELVHSDDQEYVRTELLSRGDSEDDYELIYRIRRKDGQIRWIWEHGRICDSHRAQGEVHEGLLIDVTDVKRKKREGV
jgi:PAS domain S-box-containing protein